MNEPGSHAPTVEHLHREVVDLRQQVLRMEQQREALRRRRRRHLLLVGIGVSVLVHLALMLYLAGRYRLGGGGGAGQSVTYEFAILQEEELTELETLDPEELESEAIGEVEMDAEEPLTTELEPAVPAADLEVANAGALPTLAGSGGGSGEGSGLTGAGSGTSFFGVRSRGRRFAYIVDRSGSMGQNRKMAIAMRELARSVDNLPDFASFHVVLFSSNLAEPATQRGWVRAKKPNVNRLIRWLNQVDPGGGTVPMPAFHQVFALEPRPDVIFFLTDGQIPDDTADLVAEMNRRGGRVVINTIAFGDPTSQDLLERIARESGGVPRFVPVGGP